MSETAEALAAQAVLYDFLERAGIGWRHHDHPPVFTVEEARAHCAAIPGIHVKNMFLREKKGGLWLVTCRDDRAFRIRDLEKRVGARGWSFGSPELLWQALRVRPGSVTPLALLNDREGAVQAVLDEGLFQGETVNVHPLHNAATTAISPGDLLRFVALTGHAAQRVDFGALPPPPAAT